RANGFQDVWQNSDLFRELREPQTGGACASCDHYDSCQGGCMAAKFFTGLPLDGPDPECVQGYGELALATVGRELPKPSGDHSHKGGVRGGPVPLTLSVRRPDSAPPVSACAESPLAGLPL
ncbi:MAG: mycofactocin radical maturase, partial [Frankiales bacterium]|nr:mycofactocin radical maturase [Frankiales bacterium]